MGIFLVNKNKAVNVFFITYFIFGLVMYDYLSLNFIDEVLIYGLFFFAFFGMLRKEFTWSKELVLYFVIATFYTIYSFIIKSNVLPAIFKDLIIQSKPYIVFFSITILKPVFSNKFKLLIRKISLIVGSILCIIGLLQLSGINLIYELFVHPSRYASVVTLSVILLLWSSKLSRKNIFYTILLLSCGLISGRSKFFGFYMLFLLFMIESNFNILNRLSRKGKFFLMIGGICLILVAAYPKINFYFIEGFSTLLEFQQNNTIDYNVHMLARPALYYVTPSVLIDFFPFGSGFGSFATYASEVYYSSLYEEYGIHKIYGLSREYPGFINDAFLPSLAQYGVFGIFLFLLFWRRIVKQLFINLRLRQLKKERIIGFLIIGFLIIEFLTGSTFTQNRGGFAMALLAIIIQDINFKSSEIDTEEL